MQELHPTDRILFEATPMLMAPRFGTLPSLNPGQRRLISASDGVYLEARSNALHLRRRIAEVEMPYGVIEPFTMLRYGQPPSGLLEEAYHYAAANPTLEIAACLMLDHANKGYRWHYPKVLSSSSGHITYRDDIDDDDLVLDYHSHAQNPAFFSKQDDQSDLARIGPYIAVVSGHCHLVKQSIASRIVCAPYLLPFEGALAPKKT